MYESMNEAGDAIGFPNILPYHLSYPAGPTPQWQRMYEHTSPVEGRWALSGAANNVPTPTMTAVACAPG